ncbi:MAG TPA: tetratricopeptide repeat protein [Daejeonella sp.]|nr:tetratricopeptide repeat protein [Daejeonella sp.]
MQKYLLIFVFLIICQSASAHFDFNANCIKAYEHILALRLNTAKTLLSNEKKNNPQNAIPYLLDNYVDFFTLLTTENKEDFERLKANKSSRLKRIEQDDKTSPYYLFSQAEINLQWALSRSRFDEYFTAGIEINKAHNLLQENSRKFPGFLPNRKGLGTIDALLGAMPEGLRRTMSVFGIKGNVQQGQRTLESLVKALPDSEYAFFYDESVFYLAYVQIDIMGDKGSYSKIMNYTRPIDSSSLLRTYIRAYVAMKTAHNAEAIATLGNRPEGKEYQPYPFLDYLLGMAELNALNKNAAVHFQTYLNNYHGINFIKDTYLKLAWIELLKGNSGGYQQYVAKVRSEGYTYDEKDKQALYEANSPAPDLDLLKARLAFDGGYYEKALEQLQDKKVTDFKILRDKIEYNYRLGRIYDLSNRDDLALKYYQLAVNLGRNEQYYYAANAALFSGNIYEQKRDLPQAKLFYNTALGMKNHQYQNSIDSKAKAGLRRIGN